MTKVAPTETRKCHHCGRNSWTVAEGNGCPSCGRRTGKYHFLFNKVVIISSLLAIASLAFIAVRS